MTDTYQFPDAFLFGASISAYQTGGNNTNTDLVVAPGARKAHSFLDSGG
jgi:beta-glucosidase/6-phospho-beta-glucosidase/beta-galactosidase